ncbi:hypothetical protein [Burkholderia sp. Ac-20365]|uniref:hypothetical protein n=1 Tax=Burkholderia sp. Ac-20365 TaxID=2703897 RepID=UPI00197B712E|nr:hypothetical protein [Burkholderia sp. Ac-20365]MBN3760893.1 hypothetical protein [Burkholderia sp. Ac-20365]
MRNYYEVCIRWNDNDAEEGTFTESVFANDEDEASEAVATSMAGSSSDVDNSNPDEVARFVEEALQRVSYVTNVVSSLPDDISSVFFDELFPDGVSRQINLDALAVLLSEHRDQIILKS